MRVGRARSALVVVGAVLAVVAVLLFGGLLSGGAPAHPSSPANNSGPRSSGLASCALSGLPKQADDTVEEIFAGGPFRYRQDGVIFDNRERRLPREPHGYYHEYTVPTPGSPDRGARRVIAGGGTRGAPEVLYYTGNHYASFCLVSGLD